MSRTNSEASQNSIHYRLALMWIFIAIGLHAYLTYVHFGQLSNSFSKSFCDVSSMFSCSSVAASKYSKFLGIPISLWGLMTNLVFALFLVEAKSNAAPHMIRYTQWLAFLTGAGSVVMMVISLTAMSQYCPFCIVLYVLSFLTLFHVWKMFGLNFFKDFFSDALAMFSDRMGILGLFFLIPAGAWLINALILDQYQKALGGKDLTVLIEQKINEWKANPPMTLNTTGAVILNQGKGDKQIVEFADFMCHHCQDAAPVFEEFIKNHPDFTFIYMTFPLDGECNDDIPRKWGVSCRFAKAVYCANSQTKGVDAHHWLFKNTPGTTSVNDADEHIKKMVQELGLNDSTFMDCTRSEATHQAIKAMAKEGVRAGIEGTPTVFLNGKVLPGAQSPAILKAAIQSL